MTKYIASLIGLAAAGAVAVGSSATSVQAALTPAGNMFNEGYGSAYIGSNVGVVVSSTAGGGDSSVFSYSANGDFAGGGATGYPVPKGDSPILSGGPDNQFLGIQGMNGSDTANMLNIAFTPGSFAASGSYTFTSAPFTQEIGTFVIYGMSVPAYQNAPNGTWINMPNQVKVAYSTSNATFSVPVSTQYPSGTDTSATEMAVDPPNSTTVGVTPTADGLGNALWNNNATIASVNGVAATALTGNYAGNGWVATAWGTGTLYTGNTTNLSNMAGSNPAYYYQMTLTLQTPIPVGATSVLISFGVPTPTATTYNAFTEFEAYAPTTTPEPTSLAMMAGIGAGLLLMGRRGKRQTAN